MWTLMLAQENTAPYYTEPMTVTGPVSSGGGFSHWNTLVVEPLKEFFINLMGYIPNILTAACTLAIGFLLAKLLEVIVTAFLRAVGFERFCRKTGITDLLNEGEKKVDENRWFGMMVFWLVFFISFTVSLDQLRLGSLSVQLNNFLAFAATVVKVLVTFVFGIFLLLISSRIIRTTATNLKITRAGVYAGAAEGLLAAFIVIIGLSLIGLPQQIIFGAMAVAFVALCVAFVLAFGLGGTGWAGKVLDRTLKEKK